MKVTLKLKPVTLDRLDPGTHSDGNNLYLQVSINNDTNTKRRSWVYRYRIQGRTREMGLGSYPKISLKSARLLAEEQAVILQRGDDPIEVRLGKKAKTRDTNEATAMTLKRCVNAYLASKKSKWSQEQKDRWEAPLILHVYPKHGTTVISDFDDRIIRSILEPIWSLINPTAKHVRRCLEVVIAWSIYMKYRPHGPNPAQWKNALELHFDGTKNNDNYEAMPYKEVPAFYQALKSRRALAADALRLLILTATRTNEVVAAEWKEINLETKVWTIPKERMKADKEHQIPLSTQALEIINHLHQFKTSNYVFPSTDNTTHLDESTMRYLKRRMKAKATIHGFRASFRSWADDETDYDHDMKEMALAHTIDSASEAAYRRTTMLEKRRKMMDDWAAFLTQ